MNDLAHSALEYENEKGAPFLLFESIIDSEPNGYTKNLNQIEFPKIPTPSEAFKSRRLSVKYESSVEEVTL